MAARRILFGQEGRARLLRGVEVLASAVRPTLGPRGRNVFLERPFGSAPLITKDGVTVADEIEVEERFANMGVEMVKEVAVKTGHVAGDGTTTATVLAHVIYREGAKLVAAGHHPVALKRGIDRAVAEVIEALQGLSRPVNGHAGIAQVATISSNGDTEIGEILARAIDEVGREGVISIDDSNGLETTLEVVEGAEVERGFLSHYFVTDAEHIAVELEDPYLLLYDRKITRMQELVPVLESVSRAGRPVLIIGEVEGEALATLVVNKLRGGLKVCAIQPPSYMDRRKDMLRDLAAQTGGRAITDDLGIRLEDITLEDLGRAKKIVVEQEKTTILGGMAKPGEVEARKHAIRAQREATNSTFDHKQLDERLAKLVGGVGVIRVGAATQAETREKKARVEDALHATRAALEEGIVPGGGLALLRAASTLAKLKGPSVEEQAGVAIVQRACEEPCRQIARNAGKDASVVLKRVRDGKGAWGYNAATDEIVDLIAAGVIDPTKVVRLALQNAASVAGLLITTEAFIIDAPRELVDYPTEGGDPHAALSLDPYLSRR